MASGPFGDCSSARDEHSFSDMEDRRYPWLSGTNFRFGCGAGRRGRDPALQGGHYLAQVTEQLR